SGDEQRLYSTYALKLRSGKCTLSLQLPMNCELGDTIKFTCAISDRTQYQPFANTFLLKVREALPKGNGSGRKNKKSSAGEEEADENTSSSGISIPNPIEVREEEWNEQEPPFDKFTALRIKNAGSSDGEKDDKDIFDFFVNVDNIHLQNELKIREENPE